MRRSHKKSRLGCKECKLRHVKCDETQPSCINCATASTRCSFQYLRTHPTTTLRQLRQANVPAGTCSLVGKPYMRPAVGESLALGGLNFSIHHLEFLHYFQSRLPEKAHNSIHISRDLAVFFVESAFTAPYLMYQILAFSALQLSTERPATMCYYRREADELQTRALSLFNSEARGVSQHQEFTSFLFSILLCHQQLSETFSLPSTLSSFVDRFTSCLRLHQGLRALLEIHWRAILTHLQPIFGSDVISIFRPCDDGEKNECYELIELVALSTLDGDSRMTYERCIELLCWVYRFRGARAAQRNRVVWAWLVLIPPAYIEALRNLQPEALIILAYYLVLWHDTRSSWVGSDTPKSVVQAIAGYLGVEWEIWLDWPNRALGLAR